ncbi:unnamed protein product [Lactuca saligna]|uniref:Uncharacterized protein n=1 Tax=Lactuca saligna TaxID=75948 RepID=A0AA35YG53_LACSI|nr:unnamed protein product [Lactuca saligna]
MAESTMMLSLLLPFELYLFYSEIDRQSKTALRHTGLVGFVFAPEKFGLARSNLPEKVSCNTFAFEASTVQPDPLEPTHGVLKPLSVDELSINVTEFLNIQDDTNEDSNSSPPHKPKDTTTQPPENSLSRSATFPCPDSITLHDDKIKSLDQSGFRSISLPTHLKAVSAMKGSREKHGVAPPVKLRVKWAPDVYDPIPTSVSHVVTSNRSSRHSSKKNSRNKQKNGSKSSSRGSKGKEKKQVRKRGGNSSSTGYKLHEHAEEDEDGVVFHDQFCGSSFLKGYGTNLHLSSVAEAT